MNNVAVVFDNGPVVLELGRDEPLYTMDPLANLCTHSATTARPWSTEICVNAMVHFPNGRFVTVVGDGEYINYTPLAWRNKVSGPENYVCPAGRQVEDLGLFGTLGKGRRT